MSAFAFDGNVATVIGVNAALILQHLYFWVERNRANNKHEIDGEFWTYNSRKAFQAIFPFLTDKQIRVALDKLESDKYIKTGNYNEDKRDRTKWYTVTDKGVALLKGKDIAALSGAEQHQSSTENDVQEGACIGQKGHDIGHKGQPLPDINHIYNPPLVLSNDNTSPHGGNDHNEDLTQDKLFDAFWAAYPRKTSKGDAKKAWAQIRPRPTQALLDRILSAIEWQKRDCWQDPQYIPYPGKWLRAMRWEDEPTKPKDDVYIGGDDDEYGTI